eukprot:TRINITY_DN23409_c0_g1_i2.p1 TRINITY_DN23409_c0_g1~~TRINITY_DN23409_c0_g1_i2.p1  ORF type:complete len:297 (+),score=52.58 TRINITY_DN23409_c0_g1_i2:46-936(+)
MWNSRTAAMNTFWRRNKSTELDSLQPRREEPRSCDESPYDQGSLLDPRAVAAATTLMTLNAKFNSNRQCAAASTSALFNLLVNSVPSIDVPRALSSVNEPLPSASVTLPALGSVLAAAEAAAKEMLDILPSIAPLTGHARKNVGTALRVQALRGNLKDLRTECGDDLLKELNYIADAADAGRHLSMHSIDSAMACLRAVRVPLDRRDTPVGCATPLGVPTDSSPLLCISQEKMPMQKEVKQEEFGSLSDSTMTSVTAKVASKVPSKRDDQPDTWESVLIKGMDKLRLELTELRNER